MESHTEYLDIVGPLDAARYKSDTVSGYPSQSGADVEYLGVTNVSPSYDMICDQS